MGAVQLGEILALALEQPLVIASAYQYQPVALSARVVLGADNERRFAAAEHRATRAHRLVGHEVDARERVVPALGVPEALVELAGEEDACAIVLGRDLHGHITRAVMQHAPCPVAVSPFSVALPGEGLPMCVGVAYDGSPASRVGVTAAAALAKSTGAEVQLLSVAPSGHRFPLDRFEVAERIDADVRQLHGDPAAHLIAASYDFDLLFCGSRGRGPAAARILGSVSSELVAAGHCPLVVIPPRVRPRPGTPLGLTTAEALTVRVGR